MTRRTENTQVFSRDEATYRVFEVQPGATVRVVVDTRSWPSSENRRPRAHAAWHRRTCLRVRKPASGTAVPGTFATLAEEVSVGRRAA